MSPKSHDLRRGALLLGAISVGGYLVDTAFNIGLTRFLTPHDYGDFKIAVAFAHLAGLAVLLGGDRAAPMVLSPAIERGDMAKVWEYLRFYFSLAIGLGVAVVVVTWTLAVLHVGSTDPIDHHPLAWVVVVVPINAVAAMIGRTMQSARRQARAAVPWRIGLPLAQLAVFALVVAVRGRLTVVEALGISIVAMVAITVWQWLDVRRLGLVRIERLPEASEPRAWLAMSLPMMASFLVALALSQSDLYFLEALGDEAEVGHYAAAATAAHALILAQVAVIGLVAPLARPAIERGPEASSATFRHGAKLMFAFLAPLGVALGIAAGPILGIFGDSYRDAEAVLRLLVLGNAAWAGAALSSLWLQYRGRAGVVLVISIATLVVDSALDIVLIPRYGMTGAAAATAATLTAAALAIGVAHARSPADDLGVERAN